MTLGKSMMRKGLYSISTLGLVHLLAQATNLYWVFPDLDIIMHFGGGVWLGFMATWLSVRFGIIKNLRSVSYLLVVLVVVLGVGLGWELFEYSLDQISYSRLQLGLVDTQLDLVMDLLGGFVVALWVMITQTNNKDNE